jgi:branched-chain amino acid aminotransferase
MYVYLNNRIVPSKDALVSVFDHGFLYGDGIYETMRVYDGVVFKVDEHLMRLSRSASLIGLTLPLDGDALKIAIYETLMANSLKGAYMRLTVSRGYGPIGLDPDLCKEPTLVIMARDSTPYPASLYNSGISLIIPGTRRNHRKAIDPRIKSLNFLNNILAKIEVKKAGAYEAVMLNSHGRLTEGTISNVFFFREGTLCTPSVNCGILDGITRGLVIELAKNARIDVHEGHFTVEDIYAAEEIFITNTTLEVMPVTRLDNRTYRTGALTRLLRRSYKKEVQGYITLMKISPPSLWAKNTS